MIKSLIPQEVNFSQFSEINTIFYYYMNLNFQKSNSEHKWSTYLF